MPRLTLFIVLTVAINLISLAGCGGDAARSAQQTRAQTSAAVTDPNKNSGQTALANRHARPSRKEFARDAFLSTYHDPEEGISFRYPRNYSMEEGEVLESSFFLKRQEDLDRDQPGATLLATVQIPEDGYPNTTFEHGSLQLVVNETGEEEDCRAAALVADASNTGTLKVQGITFRWSERESETAGTKILERAYAGFSQATCYEFLLIVAAEEAPDSDGFRKPADTEKIMKQLEKIVGSAQFIAKSATSPAEGAEGTRRGPLVITTSGEEIMPSRPEPRK